MAMELVTQLPYDHPYRWDGSLFGGPRLWRPNTLGSSLALWLDAEDSASVILNGSTVSQWSDKSGNGRNAIQGTAANQPTYLLSAINGKPALSFATSNMLFNTSMPIDDPFSFFAVASSTGTTAGQYYCMMRINYTDPVNLTAHGFIGSYAGDFSTFFGNGITWNDVNPNTPLTSVATTKLLSVVNAGATATPFVNGVAQNTKVGTMAAAIGYFLGTNAALAQAWTGQMAEIVIISSAVSESNRQILEGYLAWKWGLVSNLPSTHPFKLLPPTV